MSFKLVVYIPEKHLEAVKNALFRAGAGKQGGYEQCCWQVRGEGQFFALSGSHPHIGSQNQLERVPEWRVEMLVQEKDVQAVRKALLESHPYEEPAFDFIKRLDN